MLKWFLWSQHIRSRDWKQNWDGNNWCFHCKVIDMVFSDNLTRASELLLCTFQDFTWQSSDIIICMWIHSSTPVFPRKYDKSKSAFSHAPTPATNTTLKTPNRMFSNEANKLKKKVHCQPAPISAYYLFNTCGIDWMF